MIYTHKRIFLISFMVQKPSVKIYSMNHIVIYVDLVKAQASDVFEEHKKNIRMDNKNENMSKC